MNTSNWSWEGGAGGGGAFPPGRGSTLTRMQRKYWVTKESVMRRLGTRRDDEGLVASDAELDARLELLASIRDSCSLLAHLIDRYQERLLLVAQEENTLGRFLKDCSRGDRTGAGETMLAVGRTMAASGQARLSLRPPLLRLYQEVETFRGRGVEDTVRTVEGMERRRTEYRATLSWMRDVSGSLDPDSFTQLDKFKKVQGQVRKSKAGFDSLKRDTLEKVDLLCAARCNLFSQALVSYQSALLAFTSTSVQALSQLSAGADGKKFQFTVLKELSDLKVDEKAEFPSAPDSASACSQGCEEGPPPPPTSSSDKLLDFEDLEDLEGLRESDLVAMGGDLVVAGGDLVVTGGDLVATGGDPAPQETPHPSQLFLPSHLLLSLPTESQESVPQTTALQSNKESRWLDLFSELDPLSNPDSIGRSGDPLRDC